MLHGDPTTYDLPFLCYAAVLPPTPAVPMLHGDGATYTRRPRAMWRYCHPYPDDPCYAAVLPPMSLLRMLRISVAHMLLAYAAVSFMPFRRYRS
jgi:hypothetical protein